LGGLQLSNTGTGEEEQIPDDWKKVIIIPIYKKKDHLDCNNYRGISLQCHCCKLFTSVFRQRPRQITDEIISEEQAGFRPGRSTVDQIFTLRLLAEKHIESSKDLYVW